jgi:hypothetical protein
MSAYLVALHRVEIIGTAGPALFLCRDEKY